MSLVFTKTNSNLLLPLLPRPLPLSVIRFYRRPSSEFKAKRFKTVTSVTPTEDGGEGCRPRPAQHRKNYCQSLWTWQKQAIITEENMELTRIICNDEINVRIKNARDRQLVEEWAEVVQEIGERRLLKENNAVQRLELAKIKVLSEMEKLKTSISLDDLDIAIASALSSEVDYNFAIDKSGNVVSGRNNSGTS